MSKKSKPPKIIGFQTVASVKPSLPGKITAQATDPLQGICDNLRARKPLPKDKRTGQSLLEGLPDIHDVLGL